MEKPKRKSGPPALSFFKASIQTEAQMEISPHTEARRIQAPIWHTILLVAFLLAPVSLFQWGATARSALQAADLGTIYIVDLSFLWGALALTYFGLYLNGTKLINVLANRSTWRINLWS